MKTLGDYSDLLNAEKWKTRRLEIIQRDSWTCNNCKNRKILDFDCQQFYRVKHFESPKLPDGNFGFIVEYSLFMGFVQSAFLTSSNKNLFDELNPDDDTYVHFKRENNLNKVVAIRRKDCWIYVSNMHVHHKYYQEGRNPWEYPDEALVALCWSCHEELHKNTQVPYYNKEGITIGTLTPCRKCHGAGYLPEYFYYQNGICFSCMGKKYVNLTEND